MWFWIFGFLILVICEFSISFKSYKSTGVLLGFDMLDSLAFLFCFVRFWSYSNNATFENKNGCIYLCFTGFEKCVVEHRHCFITICICENVEKYKNWKTDCIPPCFVGFENPCFEHRHWKFEFEWAAATWHEASMGSLPNPGAAASQPWHEASNGEPA